MRKNFSLLNLLLGFTVVVLLLPYLVRLLPAGPISFSAPVQDGLDFPLKNSYFLEQQTDSSYHGTYWGLEIPDSARKPWRQGESNPPLSAKSAIMFAIKDKTISFRRQIQLANCIGNACPCFSGGRQLDLDYNF